jgi:NAD(P)-dependent dehydrogenase (short-subunit alcohol dehydrogenase family)
LDWARPETALYLAERGFKAHATSATGTAPDGSEAAAARGVELEVVQLDLTDSASIEIVGTIGRGGTTGLVNNGGSACAAT